MIGRLTTVCAVLCVRAAHVFVRLGGLQWPYASADEYNATMQALGKSERIGRFEALGNLQHFREMRQMVRWIARQPVLPWERHVPRAEDDEQ